MSMYRLVSVALTVLFGYSLAMALLDELSFAPLAMAVSAGVLVLAVYLSNLLFGWLFGVATHGESTYISALILFFIFTPTLTPAGLVTLGMVGVIAAAAKYILAVRGRHVFNPAAIAAVISGTIGLAFASWWVATPVLLPITLVTAGLIMYKTRRHVMSLVFLITAALLIVCVQLSYGTPWQEAVSFLASWPLLFFAGFMLTEPLTLPAKRWQQLTEAALVATLFALPLHVGEVTMTPALALIVGNVFAYCATRRQKIVIKLKERRQLTPTTDEYVFESKRPLNFEAGQFIEMTLPHPRKDWRGIRRSFSVTSVPGTTELAIGVKFYEPSSSFKQALRKLQPGAELTATGISGDFTLPKDQTQPLLFVAGGIGITPFISHLQYLQQTGQRRNITLIYAVTNPDELAYSDVLHYAECKVVVVCKESLSLPKGWRHSKQTAVTADVFSELDDDVTVRQAFISGPPGMVRSTRTELRRLGVAHIKTDYFTGY
jgi:ferredoxin-NADP reductase